VNLESPHLNLILPDLIVELNVVEDGIDQTFNVRVLVAEELEDDLDHLCLVQDNISSWLEEEELEEGV